MRTRLNLMLALAMTLSWGCNDADSGAAEASQPVSKADLQGKADTTVTAKLCKQLGAEPGCDVCAESGWYDDAECDTFCQQEDPACTPAPDPEADARFCEGQLEALNMCVDDSLDATIESCLPDVYDDAYGDLYGCCARGVVECDVPPISEDYCADLAEGIGKCVDDSLDATVDGCLPESWRLDTVRTCCDAFDDLHCDDITWDEPDAPGHTFEIETRLCDEHVESQGMCLDDSLDASVESCLPEAGSVPYLEVYVCCAAHDVLCDDLSVIDEPYCDGLAENVGKCVDDSLDATVEGCLPQGLDLDGAMFCCTAYGYEFCDSL